MRRMQFAEAGFGMRICFEKVKHRAGE